MNKEKEVITDHRVVHRLFEEMAQLYPKDIALVFQGNKMSYQELDIKADEFKSYLLQKGINKDQPVAIMIPLSIDMIIAILGILKSGGAFLPIHSDFPEKRIQYMLSSSDCRYVVHNGNYKDKVDGIELIDISMDLSLEGNESDSIEVDPSDLAYILYTSGSSGTPKGVMIEHKSLSNYINWSSKTYLDGQKLNFALFTPLHFDLTLTTIFTPLVSGSTLHIFAEGVNKINLHRILENGDIDIIKLTPSHLKLISRLNIPSSTIQTMIVGGEVFNSNLANEITEQFKDIEIYNEYGPTEATVGCMIHKYDMSKDHSSTVPIGRAIDNVNILIVDNNFLPVPPGEIGEICISGGALARGYLNDDTLTAKKFIENPYDPDQKLYLSGDYGRVLDNGLMEFAGRKDEQIKINGHRIEPSEISKALLEIEYISDCKVMERSNSGGENILCAYCLSNKELRSEDIKNHLTKSLPDYMIPAYFVQIDQFPLTGNGKLDTKALPDPESIVVRKLIDAQSEMEKVLIGYWKEVLDIEDIGITNNFFDVGGSSLKVIEICELIKEHVNKSEEDLIMLFFKYPTVQTFANSLEGTEKKDEPIHDNQEVLTSGKNRLGKLRQLRN